MQRQIHSNLLQQSVMNGGIEIFPSCKEQEKYRSVALAIPR
jgi:hypothetical protein